METIKPIAMITSTIFQKVLPNAILKSGWNITAKTILMIYGLKLF
jgi:hypothetical protein